MFNGMKSSLDGPIRNFPFGAGRAFGAELGRVGETVMLAYGGSSIKENGVYDEM